MKAFLAAASLLWIVAAQQVLAAGSGNSEPINAAAATVCATETLAFVADKLSLCWFYQCAPGVTGGYVLKPKRCPLGTHLATAFVTGTHNPCSENFPAMGIYDCTRSAASATPACSSVLQCANGAVLQRQASLCWCNCSLDWQGAPDCSVKKGVASPPPELNNPLCPGGTPSTDWCHMALPGNSNPCQNGGNCTNQCTNFVCSCPMPFTKDKLCSAFDCATPPNKCPQGQSCKRGLNGNDEFYTCA